MLLHIIYPRCRPKSMIRRSQPRLSAELCIANPYGWFSSHFYIKPNSQTPPCPPVENEIGKTLPLLHHINQREHLHLIVKVC